VSVVSNGRPGRVERDGRRTTYRWHEDRPMATYLATVSIGKFQFSTATTSTGIPVINAVVPSMQADSAASIARIPEMVDWLSTIYGPYPFDSVGATVVDAPDVGYELETQERPTFTNAPDDSTMVHELAHQWVGDSVSIASWPEIWLNEGFAGYTEWLWSEHDGGATADSIFDSIYQGTPADDGFWQLPFGPTTLTDPANLFSGVVYTRGAMTLHALRRLVGDGAFFRILRTWTTSHRDGDVTTADFVRLAERISGRSLTSFFTTWLDTPGRPAL
jgi:aminopeptidase N